MTPEERWQDARNDALDRVVTPDPPDLERPIVCWTCDGNGWVPETDMWAAESWRTCPTCKGHKRVAA